ncbi:YggS family pyridoxal phosphate-dependent enzyme [Hydrotalea sp.]|uniref:YggS family pyridoxal phosphate-dependent enzyme n=1 Tax=Hydrotalea sp. TaxID=2881279 RepID=UPI003D0ADE65
MAIDINKYHSIQQALQPTHTNLVAVSKTKPVEDILTLYHLGQRDFGENYVQELIEKQPQLPADIRWHFIGHLQKNKVKYIAPFVHLIHSVDSLTLLAEINKHAQKNNRKIDCLLEVFIANETTKFGLNDEELFEIMSVINNNAEYQSIQIRGLMGMASFTDDTTQLQKEFQYLHQLYETCQIQFPYFTQFNILSMGMSSDYRLAIANGSNMVRIGSLLFGARS